MKMENRKELRKFGLILAIILSLIGTINLYKKNITIAVILYCLCLSVLIFAIIKPEYLKPIHRAMLFVSHKIGWVNTRLLLGIIYYLVFTPIGMVMRILGRDLLDRKYDRQKNSYWILIDEEFDKKRCERQF